MSFMLSNTEKSSASESVNTRPRLNAYFSFIKEWPRAHQRELAVACGYLLVAVLFYNLGQFAARTHPPEIRVEEPAIDLTQVYNSLQQVAGQTTASGAAADTAINCEGKIKGNISSSGKIYHLPGGAFYKRTNPEMCFATEADAQAAGFRKSQR